jgi:hypothetical protein
VDLARVSPWSVILGPAEGPMRAWCAPSICGNNNERETE